METPNDNQPPYQPISQNRNRLKPRRGVALILVVSFIVLLSALVVGFFSRVQTDLAGARSYSEGVSVRQLADSAVGVVMGQIRSATTIKNAAWASQPGMIRTYRSGGGQPGSRAYAFYKLYSSPNLVVSGGDLSQFGPTLPGTNSDPTAEVPLGASGWIKQPAFFTDLNEPVDVPDPASPGPNGPAVKRYPIFDPSVARIPAINQNTKTHITNWVEGCEVNLPQGADLTKNNAPMPVRWLYVLKDGTLSAPTPLTGPATGTNGLKATWAKLGVGGSATGVPTKDNPIVGRIAFWTDDDTCKVNINTAGGFLLPNNGDENTNLNNALSSGTVPETNPAFFAGSFWDTPRVQTTFDRGKSGAPAVYRPGLANSQPVRNEFQRYPGHPSTTSLGLVLKYLLPGKTGFNSEKLYALTPRLTPGASEGGTKQLLVYGGQVDPLVYGIVPDPPISTKKTYDSKNTSLPSYHLLGSVDELYYSTANNTPNSNGKRQTAIDYLSLSQNSITPRLVDQARFFMTAHNRSPELNLFGRPRVSIWPTPSKESEALLASIPDPDTHKPGIRNATDDLLRFCSTVGGDSVKDTGRNDQRRGQFIFNRDDPYSSTADFNLPRNRKIFEYLSEVTNSSKGLIPGWGASFENKYGGSPGGREQILTEIFDYIRAVNLKDTSRDERIDRANGRTSSAQKAVPAAENLKKTARYAKEGIVVPTRLTNAGGQPITGFGRFPTISEVSLVFYHGGYLYTSKAGEDVEYNWTILPKLSDTSGNTAWEKRGNTLTGKLMRAFLVIETFNPMQGYGPVSDLNPNNPPNQFLAGNQRIVHEITNFPGFFITPTAGKTSGNAQPLNLGIGKNNTYLSSGSQWAGRNFGGTEGFFHTMVGKISNVAQAQLFPWSGTSIASIYQQASSPPTVLPQLTFNTANAYYPFQSPCAKKTTDGVRFTMEENTFGFSGGSMDLSIRYMDKVGNKTHDELVQTFKLTWPKAQGWPVPITEREATVPGEGFRFQSTLSQTTTTNIDVKYDYGGFNINTVPGFDADQGSANFGSANHQWTLNGGYRMPFHLPLRIRWAQQQSNSPWWGVNGTVNDSSGKQITNGKRYMNRFLQILQPGDTIRSLVPGGGGIQASVASDPRVTHLQKEVKTFQAILPDYTSGKRRVQTLRRGDGGFYFDPTNTVFFPNETSPLTTGVLVGLPNNVRYGGNSGPDLPKGVTAMRFGPGLADFDTGIGNFPDGAFCSKADEGNLARSWQDQDTKVWTYVEPYFGTWAYDPPGDTYFSPNRQIPSPVMFGSLLAPQYLDWSKNGWKTLLFRPDSEGTHPGAQNPPDHLLLDLFNMPVVEPYAISEPFSTDGKVNLNYPIMPFGYIKRSTALRAALHPLRVTAIPNTFTKTNGNVTELRYKTTNQQGKDNPENLRYLVDRDETLKAFDAFFDEYQGDSTRSKGFFKSATEICERYLYPKGNVFGGSTPTFPAGASLKGGEAAIKLWWSRNTLTGDNVREKPYGDLYPRITTKSNTYTVHYRVQTLRQRPYTGNSAGAAAYYGTWDEARDQVLSEYRGHTTIERYLDPEDARFSASYSKPDKINVDTDSLEDAYRFRVIYNKRFSPW